MSYEEHFISNAVLEELRVTNSQVCALCGHTLGEHSFGANHCPSYAPNGSLFLDSSFTDDLESWYRFGKGAN